MIYDHIIANTIALEILDSGIAMPSLPGSAHEILAMAQKPISQIELSHLEALIQKDPVLFAQLINLANSPFYRTTVEVTGLRTAIMRIGLIDTLNTLNHYLFKKALPPFPKMDHFSDKAFWEESWACAIANRRLGDPRLMVETHPGELYIAGLLHGIGRLILAVYDPVHFNQCLEMAKKSGRTLEEMELKIFKTTDALVARHLLKKWNIPEKVCEAVAHWKSPEASDPNYREITALTQFACAIVRISGVVDTCEGIQYRITSPCLNDLSETYLLQNPTFPMVAMNKQYQIVQEIVAILEKHFLPEEEAPQQEKKKSPLASRKGVSRHHNDSNSPHNSPPDTTNHKNPETCKVQNFNIKSPGQSFKKKTPPRKTGWLAWLKSLFN